MRLCACVFVEEFVLVSCAKARKILFDRIKNFVAVFFFTAMATVGQIGGKKDHN